MERLTAKALKRSQCQTNIQIIEVGHGKDFGSLGRLDDMLDSHARGFRSATAADPIRDLLLLTGSPVEESLSHLDVAGHADTFVTLQRLIEQRLRLFAIPWGGAID